MHVRTAQPNLRPIIAPAALLGLALTFGSWPAAAQGMDPAATRGLRTGRDPALPAVHLGHWPCQVMQLPCRVRRRCEEEGETL
jgi:hypothetical protein